MNLLVDGLITDNWNTLCQVLEALNNRAVQGVLNSETRHSFVEGDGPCISLLICADAAHRFYVDLIFAIVLHCFERSSVTSARRRRR
jgi:hypothetical protein